MHPPPLDVQVSKARISQAAFHLANGQDFGIEQRIFQGPTAKILRVQRCETSPKQPKAARKMANQRLKFERSGDHG
jgi:hypothetical protein